MSPFKPNPAGMAQLRQVLTAQALKGAQAGAAELRGKLGQAGSGVHYAGQPNRSSAKGEYPARQTGDLQNSIAAREAGDLKAEFGPLDNPPPEAYFMQILPPDQGGRDYMGLAYGDEDVRAAVLKGVRDAD